MMPNFAKVQINKTIKILSFLAIIIVITFVTWNSFIQTNEPKLLKVGYPQHWGSLIPALQHTAYADAIILNEFEPLVEMGDNGVITPLAAKSWEISNDFRVFTFKIDTSKKFSNGEKLTADHFKRSWEHGMTLTPISHNKSAADALYNLEGFEDFEHTGKLNGVKIIDQETLQLNYKRPFRRALDHLIGGRYAAYIHKDGKYYGTGRYVLNENTQQKKVLLEINPYHAEKKNLVKVEISVIHSSQAEQALKTGSIDIYDFAEHADFHDICINDDKKINCNIGQEQANIVIVLNGLPGRTFSNPNYKLAFQALIAKNLVPNKIPEKYLIKGFELNYQVYLPFQKGALDKNEVMKIIQEGERYIPEFISYTKKNPLYFVCKDTHAWMIKFLKDNDITLTENSGEMDWNKAIKMAYQTSEMDLFMASFTIGGTDPDCLYHVLGKNGSILLPMMYRKSIAELLEQGRELIDPNDIDSLYKEVNKQNLKEVPFVHLGTIHNLSVFRADRVKVLSALKKREDNKYHIYKPM